MLKEKLQKAGYYVHEFENAAEAVAWLDSEIDGSSVGFGGSATVAEIGLYERLKSHNEVHWHADVPQGMNAMQVRRLARDTEIYVSSANALAETGEIVNIDATGNRVSEISFGHRKVYLVIGRNKIVPDLTAAIDRARNVAAPKNAQRLQRNTPCALHADRCYDCQSPECICRHLSILLKAPSGAEYHLVLINEDLGF